MDWMQLIQQLGFPSVALLAVGWGLWRIAQWIGVRADKGLDAHLELVKTTTDAAKSTVESVEQIKNLLEHSNKLQTELQKELIAHRAKMEG